MSSKQYSKEDCIESLREAAEQLGKSPTQSEYASLDILPSTSYIAREYGWNSIKEDAELKSYSNSYSSKYDKEDIIEGISEVASNIGRSPTMNEYSDNKEPYHPCSDTVVTIFDSWNEAKEAADLEIYSARTDCPNLLDMSNDEWWELEKCVRSRLRKKSKINKFKLDNGCRECGYCEHPSALSFHHRNPEEKEFTISKYGAKSSVDVWEEIEKCDILCECCHQKLESKWDWNVD
jgi:hypothetical protein